MRQLGIRTLLALTIPYTHILYPHTPMEGGVEKKLCKVVYGKSDVLSKVTI